MQRPSHKNTTKRNMRPSVANNMRRESVATVQTDKNSKLLISRRRFLYGACGIGIAGAAIALGGLAYSRSVNASKKIEYTNPPADALKSTNDFTALDSPDEMIQQVADYELPYGSLVWSQNDAVAACLIPTDKGSPLVTMELLNLKSGYRSKLLDKAIGADEGYEIFDVRAHDKGIIWTEANILNQTWRIYTSAVDKYELVRPTLADEGDSDYSTPLIALSPKHAFWCTNPLAQPSTLPSRLCYTSFGNASHEIAQESTARYATIPYAYDSLITTCARISSSPVHYQMQALDTTNMEVVDELTLPPALTPTECGYGNTGFMFSFPSIYNRKDAFANLGTYVPRTKAQGSDYESAPWFNFTRTPTAAPAWCNDLLIVKSTYAVCGIDLKKGTYCALNVDNGADTYGEYLASSGHADTFTTFTNIDHIPVKGDRLHHCLVKVWKAL